MSETDYDTPSQKLWEAERIIAENSHSYRIVWRGLDPATGSKWEPTWENKSYANSVLADSWKAEQAKIKQAKKAKKLAKANEVARRKALRSPSLVEPEDSATQANPIPDESYQQAPPAPTRPRKSYTRKNKAVSAAPAISSDEQVLPPRSKARKVKPPPQRASTSSAKSTPRVTKKRTVAFVEVEVEDERPRKKFNKLPARRETSVSSTTSESIQPLGHHSSASASKGKGKGKATEDSSPAQRKKKAIPRIPTSSTESTQIVPDSQMPSLSSQAGPSVASSQAGPSNTQKDVEMEETQPDSDEERQDGQRRVEEEDLGGMSPPQYDAPGFSQENETSQNRDNAFRSSGLDPMLGAATQEGASQFADADTQQQPPPRQKLPSPAPAPAPAPLEQIPSSVSPPPAPRPAPPPPPAPPAVLPSVAPKNALRPVPIPRREAFNLPAHASSQANGQDPIVDSSPDRVHRPTGGFRPTAAVEIKKRPLAMGRLDFVPPPAPPRDPTPPLPNDPASSPLRRPTHPLLDSLDALLGDEDDAAILAVVDDAVAQLGAVAAAAAAAASSAVAMNQREMEKMVEEEEERNEFNQFLDQSYHQAEGDIVFDEAPGMIIEPVVVEKELEDGEEESDDESLDEVEIGMKIVFEKLRIQDTLITALRAELSTLKSASPSPALVALETELALRPLKEENLSLTSSLEKATSTIDSLRASISDAQADVAYMRDQYQNASTAAAARAQECFVAETESKRLTSLIDIGMKQYDLIYVAQIDKLKKELARTKGELGLAEEMNERTRGVRKMASLWEEHLAAERLEEAEREERESRMIEERQAAMLLDPIPSNSNSVARNGRNGFDSSDEDDSEDDSDEEALVALVQEVEDGLVDQRMEETQDPDDPDVFVCLWRPGCGEALSSRNCLEDHIIAHHILQTTDNENLPPLLNTSTFTQLSQS